MTKNNNNEGRVAQLAATLPTIDAFETFFDSLGELEEEAADYCSYNSSFFCNGEWVKCDYEDTAKACIIQCVEDYQVLRFFAVDVFLDGSDYYHLATSDPDECLDDEMEYHQLEVKSAEEYRQVWFDKQGNIVERLLTDDYNKNERDWNSQLVSAQSFQPWIYEPRHKNYLLAEVSEYTYYYNSRLSWILSNACEYIRKNIPQIFDMVNDNTSYHSDAERFLPTIRIANRHHFAFPTDSTNLSMYFDYLRLLELANTDLRNPRFICREDWREEHQRLLDKREQLKLEKELREARELEEKFKEIHKDCMGIVFDTEDYHFQSLDSVEAYIVEGRIMHHCIAACKFYLHEDEMSFHISDHEGNRVATCTVNLKEKRVRELQTICNNAAWRESEEYKILWNIMSARAHTFRRKRKATSSTTKADRKAA